MSSATITINDSAAAAKVFTLRGMNGLDAEYVETAQSNLEPRTIVFKHTLAKPGVVANDRHLVQFQKTCFDATAKTSSVGTVNLSVSWPRSDGFTASSGLEMKDLLYFVKNWLTDANIAAMADGVQ